jgi:hypothetical protein
LGISITKITRPPAAVRRLVGLGRWAVREFVMRGPYPMGVSSYEPSIADRAQPEVLGRRDRPFADRLSGPDGRPLLGLRRAVPASKLGAHRMTEHIARVAGHRARPKGPSGRAARILKRGTVKPRAKKRPQPTSTLASIDWIY